MREREEGGGGGSEGKGGEREGRMEGRARERVEKDRGVKEREGE